MKSIRKMDEMEMSINMRAIKLAWVYSNLFLLGWIYYDWIKMNTLNSMALILMSSQFIIYWTIQLYLNWKLGKDEK
jgi:hypothetical protein